MLYDRNIQLEPRIVLAFLDHETIPPEPVVRHRPPTFDGPYPRRLRLLGKVRHLDQPKSNHFFVVPDAEAKTPKRLEGFLKFRME